MISSGINLVMTVIGFAVSTMFIVFVCTRLICARIHLNATRRSFAVASRSDLSVLERGLHGLEPLVIANFPTKKYRDAIFSSDEDTICTVCLAEYQAEDILRILPFCGHSFHATCVDLWLRQHSTCPVCRISLRELPEKKWFMQPMFSSAVRSQYGMESVNTSSYPFVPASRRFSFRSCNGQRMAPIQEIRHQSEGNGMEGGESNVPVESGQVTKCTCNKQVESPSNP